MKNQKLNFISLKKNKNINNIMPIIKNDSSILNKSKEDGPFYLLPTINKSVANMAYQNPTSILTRYITYHAENLIRTTEENLKKPEVLKNIDKQLMLKSNKNKKFLNQFRNRTIQTEANSDLNKSKDNEKTNDSKKINKLYLTEQDSNASLLKVDNKINKNIQGNKSKLETESNYTFKKESFPFEERFSTGYKEQRRKFESSMSLDRALNKNKFAILNNTFHRLRTYQPKIEENWKSTHGLTINIGAMAPRSKMDGEIEYQHKTLNDQFKLLMDKIQFYKMNILSKENFIESFKCLSLKNKINYNKSLEEFCGLLLLLPQLILLEFYKYIEKFENLNIPDKNKFKDKYIFDEISCLYYNNNLLSEVSEYFQNCFEVYLILVKEVDDMSLKPKNFNNALSAFEKARYDISYACNLAENAMEDYSKDVGIINKLNRIEMIKNKLNNTGFSNKLRNQYSLKQNNDRQKRLRIEACLSNKDDENKNKYNDFISINKENKISFNRRFKSIVGSDLMTKILKHCKKDVKYQITTERINNELDDSSGDEKIKKTHNIIKLNF